MYGKQRFLNNNLITDASMITASSQASGRITSITTTATGTALWESSGEYTGAMDLLVTIQIDDVSAGKEIGEATFSWKTSETVSGWEATGVTTSATAISLGSNGLEIFWTAGTGNDFENGDIGTFWAYASFGPEQLLDCDPNSYWKATGGTSENLVIDFGSAKTVTACIIAFHNSTETVTFTLQANSSNSWGSPAYSSEIAFNDPAVLYLSQTYRYWRVVLIDSAPSVTFQIGEIYLGTYTELVGIFARVQWGSEFSRTRRMITSESETGRRTQRIWSVQRVFDLMFDALDNTDELTFLDVWESTFDLSTGLVIPIWVHYFSDASDFLMLCHFLSDYTRTFRSFGINRVQARCEEVALIR